MWKWWVRPEGLTAPTRAEEPNAKAGKVTNQAVAETFGLEFVAAG